MIDFTEFYGLDKHYIDNLIREMKIAGWEKQDQLCGRVEGQKYPTLSDDAYETMCKIFDDNIGTFRDAVCMAFLDYYYRDIINAGLWKGELEEYFGWQYPDWEDDLPFEAYYEHNDERMTRPAFLPY